MYLMRLMTIYRKIVGDMKLQLDENTLNAYINEAIRQELNEVNVASTVRRVAPGAIDAGKRGLGTFMKKFTNRAPRTIQHSTPNASVIGNASQALDARRGIMGLKKGKPVYGVLDRNTSTLKKGQKWAVQKGSTGKMHYYIDDGAGGWKALKSTDPEFKTIAKSVQNHLGAHSAGEKIFNSAQRNMLGTAGVVGAGVGGYAVGKGSHKDDPWNDNNPTPGNPPSNPEPGQNPWDGSFPWDDTEPRWTPRPAPRTAPAPATEPAAPRRAQLEPVQPVQPIEMPGTVTGPEGPGLATRQEQPSLAQQAVRVMGQTANQSNMGLNDRRATNRRTRQNANNAINQMVKDGSMTRQQARDDKKLVKGAERALRTGKPVSE